MYKILKKEKRMTQGKRNREGKERKGFSFNG